MDNGELAVGGGQSGGAWGPGGPGGQRRLDVDQGPVLRAGSARPPRTGQLSERVRADGRHLSAAGLPLRVKGATYGSFRARPDGQLFPSRSQVRADLEAMAAAGLNVLRTYTTPPEELLEDAEELGLRVLVGLHYEDWRHHGTARSVHRAVLDAGRRALDEALARVDGRPGVLALSVGNEVPADLVRLHGIRPVEKVLSQLVAHAHAADPALLVTYSNYPTTEYLTVDGIDLTCFNVFLEDSLRLQAYLRHLQVVAGDTPLVITELGLASEVHGEREQARALEAQLRVVDESGCSGATVFSWTDEWSVAGQPVAGWGFGLTRSDREAKPALDVVRAWAVRDVRDLRPTWPPLSVVVCAYNEDRLLDECLASLDRLDYPDLDVVVCDDGSTDRTLDIARRYPFRVLELPHGGLSAARNAGARAARGDHVAYLDADAHCHPEWPYHLVLSLEEDGVVASGGPNLPVPGSGFVERAVSASPGAPVEVLVADDRAEHVPGCNLAVRRDALLAIGGFDVVYTSAGDDVDVCWKLQDRGGAIAFAHAAQVRHHRRSTVSSYLRQQRGYGRAERMVAVAHPHRFNRLGQARWNGVVYGGLRVLPAVLRPVVYHGTMGAAAYQPVARRRGDALLAWYGALLPLTVPVGVAGLALSLWHRAWALVPLLSLAAVLAYAVLVAAGATPARRERHPWRWRALVSVLHVAQPFVRAAARCRRPRALPPALPGTAVPRWSGNRGEWLRDLHRDLSARPVLVRRGGASDRCDLVVGVGPVLRAELTTAVQWSWTPVLSYRIRPRAGLVLGVAVAALLSQVHPALAAVVPVLVLVEAVLLTRLVRDVMSRSVAGATAVPEGPAAAPRTEDERQAL